MKVYKMYLSGASKHNGGSRDNHETPSIFSCEHEHEHKPPRWLTPSWSSGHFHHASRNRNETLSRLRSDGIRWNRLAGYVFLRRCGGKSPDPYYFSHIHKLEVAIGSRKIPAWTELCPVSCSEKLRFENKKEIRFGWTMKTDIDETR